MLYIHDFHTYSLNEQHLNEKVNLKGWKRLFSKIKKDLNLNFFFISTFGMTIEAFFPVIAELFENQNLKFDLSKTQICLLTITAITILIKENKESIKKLKEKLKEENIFNLLEDTIKAIKSIKNILGNIFVKLGHLLVAPGSLMDLFAYTALLLPSITIFKNIIQQEGITINNIIGLGLSYSLALGTLIGKQLIKKLIDKIKKVLGKKEINESKKILNFIEYSLV